MKIKEKFTIDRRSSFEIFACQMIDRLMTLNIYTCTDFIITMKKKIEIK